MDITVQELKEKLEAGDKFTFIDVREPWEYEEFNLGAQLIPLNQLINGLWELEDKKEEEVVLYCRSGSRSGMAQMVMTANGFKNARNLKGGVLAWISAYGQSKP